MIATIKLKEVTASDLFRRLNSYSKQHALYRALKAFRQIPKSLFILQVIDDPVLRASHREADGSDRACASLHAGRLGEQPGGFLQAEKEDQEEGRSLQAAHQELHLSPGIISICRRSWKRSPIPRAARRFSTRWPMVRRLPGGTSTCSASMISRQKSCGTASGSDSQNWGAKK
jgi:Tn3 transposase DDE domain